MRELNATPRVYEVKTDTVTRTTSYAFMRVLDSDVTTELNLVQYDVF